MARARSMGWRSSSRRGRSASSCGPAAGRRWRSCADAARRLVGTRAEATPLSDHIAEIGQRRDERGPATDRPRPARDLRHRLRAGSRARASRWRSIERSRSSLIEEIDQDSRTSRRQIWRSASWRAKRYGRRGARPASPDPPVGDPRSRFLTDVIVDLGLVSRRQVEEAIETSRGTGTMPERVLLDSGALTQDGLTRALAERYGLDHLDLGVFSVDMTAANLVSIPAAKRYQAVPVAFADKRTLLVAMADPSNVLAVDDIAIMTGYEVRVAVAPPEDIANLISRLDRLEDVVSEQDGQIEELERGRRRGRRPARDRRRRAGRQAGQPDRGAGRRAGRLRHASGARRTRAARALPGRRGPARRHHRPAADGGRRGLAREDHGGDEHRRAAPAAGRPCRADGRRASHRPARGDAARASTGRRS